MHVVQPAKTLLMSLLVTENKAFVIYVHLSIVGVKIGAIENQSK